MKKNNTRNLKKGVSINFEWLIKVMFIESLLESCNGFLCMELLLHLSNKDIFDSLNKSEQRRRVTV